MPTTAQPAMPTHTPPRWGGGARRVGFIVLAGLVLAHVLATRWSWRDIPLQTDTGIWAYFGWRILDEALPYRDLWDNKPPGVFYAFAAVEWLFGGERDPAAVQSHLPLLWLDALLTVAVCGLAYLVARRFAGRLASLAAVALLSLVFCHRVLADWGDNAEKFVALFEMLACLLILRAHARAGRGPGFQSPRPTDRPSGQPSGAGVPARHPTATGLFSFDVPLASLAAGLCCGVAAMFKQTGMLFLLAALLWNAWRAFRGRQAAPALKCIGALILGAAAPWLILGAWMLHAGIFADFWRQAVAYDLLRVGSGDAERSRLLDVEHWRGVLSTLELTAILFAPAAVGLLGYLCTLRKTVSPAQHPSAPADRGLLALVVAYSVLTVAVFPVAPHGYGHYLLQAALPAAVLVAWWFGRIAERKAHQVLSIATACALVASAPAQRDHFAFTFDPDNVYRLGYRDQAVRTAALVELVRSESAPGESVMVWPTDHAVSFYAARRTPLEVGHSIDIFQGKLALIDPPMPEFLRRVQADPPDVIVDWSGLRASAQDFSLQSAPAEPLKTAEDPALAPWRQWIGRDYHLARRIGRVAILRRK